MKLPDEPEDPEYDPSPSVRRAWIETEITDTIVTNLSTSPSVRRAWIETGAVKVNIARGSVALRAEGVD